MTQFNTVKLLVYFDGYLVDTVRNLTEQDAQLYTRAFSKDGFTVKMLWEGGL